MSDFECEFFHIWNNETRVYNWFDLVIYFLYIFQKHHTVRRDQNNIFFPLMLDKWEMKFQ